MPQWLSCRRIKEATARPAHEAVQVCVGHHGVVERGAARFWSAEEVVGAVAVVRPRPGQDGWVPVFQVDEVGRVIVVRRPDDLHALGR